MKEVAILPRFLLSNCNCANKIEVVDYKDTELLKRFISERGKILPRRVTGTSAKNQRKVVNAIKRARVMALLPFVAEDQN